MLKQQIQKLVSGSPLTYGESRSAMESMLAGDTSPVQIAAFLTALRQNGETVQELSGMLEIMRERMVVVHGYSDRAIDLCGTGGDGSGSFNLSTAAAIVAAAGGVVIAKHAGRAASSRSGSVEFAQALGLPVRDDPRDVQRLLNDHGFAMLFAGHFHAAARHVAPVRKELGIRTVFNLLGPLANPARVKRQLVGVYSEQWLTPLLDALLSTGSAHVMVVHGEGGLDELSAAGQTVIAEGTSAYRRTYTVTPSQIGVRLTSPAAIAGGTPEENAAHFLRLCEQQEPDLAEWVIANAAPAFYLSDKVATLAEGASRARSVIASGTLAAFVRRLQSGVP
ncbi:anthranilate phosphoribosyltransferase [candidate division KSB1 bacterium]|nr:anthranilate phosphoribosyltransferase [candidate division KSB1 bacterium]